MATFKEQMNTYHKLRAKDQQFTNTSIEVEKLLETVSTYLKDNPTIFELMTKYKLDFGVASTLSMSFKSTEQIESLSSIVKGYFSSALSFLDNSEVNSESELLEEFEDITSKFEKILDSPEVPEEFHNNIIAIKESVELMDDSEIKNKLIQMSNQFKVIETTIGTNGDSNTTVTFPPEVMNVFQSINDNMVNLANKIENYPNNPKSVNLIKQLIIFIFWLISTFVGAYIVTLATDCYNSSHLHEKMTQQLSSPLDTNQSSPNEKSKSDLVPNNQSNHNE